MPWAAVPYELSFIKDELNDQFNVLGLPTFVILSGTDGSLIDIDGRATVLGAKSDISKALSKWSCVDVK